MLLRKLIFLNSVISLVLGQMPVISHPTAFNLPPDSIDSFVLINPVLNDSISLRLYEGYLEDDTVVINPDNSHLQTIISKRPHQDLLQITCRTEKVTILGSLLVDKSSADTLGSDSLEMFYKHNLLIRNRKELYHLEPPSDTTSYYASISGSHLLTDGLYKIEDLVSLLANLLGKEHFLELVNPTMTDTVYLRLFPTQFPRNWIEPYSIEQIFAELIADRDSVRHFMFTYPSDLDTVYSPKYRFGGWARDTAAVLLVVNDTVPIFSSGSFVGLFDIESGWNSFKISYTTDTCKINTAINLFRPTPFDPEQPYTQIDQNSIIPENNITIYRPDRLIVRFRGTPDGTAQFKIPSLTGGFMPMSEIISTKGEGTGLYEGVFEITDDDKCRNKPIFFKLKGPDARTVKANSTGRLTVAIKKQPVLLQTAWNTTLVRHAPHGEILTILSAGIMVKGIADLDRYWKVALSNHRTAYITSRAVTQLPSGRDLPQSGLYGISTEVDSGWVSLLFNLTEQVPFKIVQSTVPQKLAVYFYRTRFMNEWTVYADSCPLIDHYEWVEEEDDVLRFDIFLNTDQQWGYRGYYDRNSFRFDIKLPPVLNPVNPFEGLTFILDAGHGGKHRGAVGPSGINEKDVNLVYAQYLGKMLQDRGATVVPTRQVDTTLQLYERMIIAREAEGDIFLWLHNNAPGSSRNPMEVSGTSTYYTSPQNWPFARTVYPHLVDLGLEPFGQVHRTYYITRQTDMIIFLVEGAFMSHPEDELFMLSDQNLKKLAAAVLNGIEQQLIRISN